MTKDGGTIIKSEDPGETLEEAGIAGDEGDAGIPGGESDGGETDGAEDQTGKETGEDESDEAGDEDSDAGGEGEEADRGRGKDAKGDQKEGEPTELDAIKEILKQRDAELERLKAEREKPQGGDAQPEPMTDEKWAALEERFGGLSRTQIQPLAELVDRRARAVEEAQAARFARIEKELAISEMAEQDGTRDVRSHRKEMDEFMSNFDPSTHSDPKLLKMALAYARGVKAQSEKKSPTSKERGLRVVGAGKPNTGGSSAGGKPSGVKLTLQERQAARAGGMSESEYAAIKYGGRRR